MPDFLFDANDLAPLTRLSFRAGLPSVAAVVGHRRAQRAGEGLDFLDYRRYVPGEDVRRIDWNVFARLRQPFIRVLHREDVLHVHFLVDLSRSMAAGTPTTKAALACQVVSGLCFVALRAGDHVSVGAFSDSLRMLATNLHAPSMLQSVVSQLRKQPVQGKIRLEDIARSFIQQARRRGLVVLISDFLGAGDVESAVETLVRRRYRLLLVQILDGIDWGEGLAGPLRVIDAETGAFVEVSASEETLAEHRQIVQNYVDGLELMCTRFGQMFTGAKTTDPFLEIITRTVQQQGLFGWR